MEDNPRPSWQIDLKWVCGIAACVAIAATGVFISLTAITVRDRAEPLAGVLLAFMIDDRVTDEEFAQVQKDAAAGPNGLVSFSPVDLQLTGSEVAGLPREEVFLPLGAGVAAVLYQEGEESASMLLLEPGPDAEGEPQEAISFGPVGTLNADRHATFRLLFAGALVVSLVLLTLVVLLSRGFGRLGAPAVAIVIGSAPLAFFWTVAGNAVGQAGPDEPVYGVIARELARNLAGDLRGLFLAALISGFVWIAVAVVGTLLSPLARKIDRRLAVADSESVPTPEPLG